MAWGVELIACKKFKAYRTGLSHVTKTSKVIVSIILLRCTLVAGSSLVQMWLRSFGVAAAS